LVVSRKELAMQVDGGELFARMLAREGVENVFALHGDAWARTTGRPGVAVVTAGPGVTDIVTAVANAHMDCVPMVVVGGRYSLGEEETLPLQELHGLPLMESITKWSRTVRDTERIPEYVSMAFRQATTGRPGPVFLEIPMDVLYARVEEDRARVPQTYRPESAPTPPPEAIEAALKALGEAERPMVMAGRGVWFAGAAEELGQFAEVSGIPVIANGMTRGSIPEDSRLSGGSFMVGGRAMALAGGPDVVLLMGGRLGMFTGGRQSIIPPHAKVIQVDIEGEEIGRVRDIEVGIVADCRETLRAMIREAGKITWPSREDQAGTTAGAMFADALAPDRKPIHPYRLAHEVAGLVAGNGVLVADGGETFVWAEMALSARRPGRYLGHGYLGCLGTGIPFGLACKLAHPDERVLVLTGDGSVGLNFSEFDTAVRHNLPIVVVVNNDQAWGMCKHEQVVRLGEERIVATELGPTRYEKAAEAFGVHAEFVEEVSDVVPAIERAFASGRPACVNVMTDPDVISPFVQASTTRMERPWAEAATR
jgi:acetolactate synthase-1/2/3 large subunit